jgi:hypothetical protein
LDRNESAKQTLALEYTFGRRAGKSMVSNIQQQQQQQQQQQFT